MKKKKKIKMKEGKTKKENMRKDPKQYCESIKRNR